MAVTLEFGGKTRELFFGLKEIKELEIQLGGMPIGTIMGQLAALSVTATQAALYVALKEEDKSLNPTLVLRMLDEWVRPISRGGQNRKIKPIADALSAALDETGLFKSADDPEGTEAEGAEGNAPGRRRSPSGSSGRNPSASGSSD